MKFKEKQSMIIGLVLVLIMISAGFLTGCTSNDTNTNENIPVSYPVLSTTDGDILNAAYDEYEALKQNLSYEEARLQLLEKLNNETGVEKAELGLDGYTIFVTYTDGDFAGINTFELDEEAPQKIGFSSPGYSDFSENDYLSKYTLQFDSPSIRTTNSQSKKYAGEAEYNIIIVGSEGKTTCESKKVLILGPCYWEFPKEPTDNCINYFKQHGWTDEDISVKLVTIDPYYDNTDCMTLIPNDYFDLEDYGIILFVGHGLGKVYDSYNETGMYLEFCYLNNASFANNPSLQKWKDQKQLLIVDTYKIGKGDSSQFIYRTAIRGDLLRSQMNGGLPSSFVYLATCYGGFFNKIFLDKGAKIVLGWDNLVKATYADGNMENIVKIMLENQSCVYSAYTDHAIVKGYCSWDPGNPFRGLTPAFNEEPQNTRPNVNFDIFPDPSVDTISFSFYFPTWADIELTGIPDGTNNLRIRVYDKDSNLLIQGEKTVGSEETELEINYMADACFPPDETYTIEITAFDSSSQELATVETTVTFDVGRNNIQKQIQQSGGLTIEFFNQDNGQLEVRKSLYQSWYLMIDAKLENRPNGEIIYVWDNLGDSSLGGFNYNKEQHLETDDNDVAFYSSGVGEDGTMIPITCTAYLVREDGARELIDVGSAEIEVYNPAQIYELCSNSDGTEGLRLGSGSSWSFYIEDHGPIYNQFYARTGDQIRAYCAYAGYISEYLDYDIYIRLGTADDPPAATQLIVSESEMVDGLNKIVTINIQQLA